MKKLLFPFVLLLFAVAVQAQIQDPVKFNSELKILAADEALRSHPICKFRFQR